MTAEMFEAIKKGRSEPDAVQAAAVGQAEITGEAASAELLLDS